MQNLEIDLLYLIYLLFSTLFAYTIKGIAGFGNTLLMTPLFSFILESKQITPVDLLLSIPINAFIVLRDKKSFSLKIVVPLSVLLLIGDVIGSMFLVNSNDKILKIFLSILIIGIAIEMWTRPQKIADKKPQPILLGIIGVLSGITAGIFGISVLLVAYISRTTTNRSEFRANLGFVFLVDNLFRLFYYSTLPKPIITQNALIITLTLLPAVIIGMYIGIKIDHRLKETTIKKIFVILLISTGILLFVQNVFVQQLHS